MAEQHEKALVPQIRFTGFTDPWEQRKLGELSNEFKSGEFICADNVSVSGSYPVYGGNGLRGYTTTFNHEGLYTLIGRQGALCGNVNIADGKSYFTEHAVAVKANHLNDTTFLYYLFGTLDLGQYSGQSAQPGLAVSNLVEVEAMVPDKAEQKKISRVFKTVDSLITLHQRKYDKLCVLKKSMLDKMFPKGGSLYPEIRFAGFTDPWEQRKLSSTCEQLSRTINPLETPNEEFTEYSMPAFDNNETAETVIGNSMNSLRKIVDRPCLLVNKLNVRKKRIWHVPRPEANAVCSSEFVPFSSHSSDLSFIKISLLSERITAYLESCSSGSSNSQKRVTPEIIMSSEIIAPSLAEQRRIGAFFDRLDSLITLHQRKLELLRNIKKSMLDKMFV